MADSQSPSLSEILSQLEGKTTADSEKREVYLKFSRSVILYFSFYLLLQKSFPVQKWLTVLCVRIGTG